MRSEADASVSNHRHHACSPQLSPLVDQKCINLRYAGMIARPLRDGFASATVKCVARRASGEVFRV